MASFRVLKKGLFTGNKRKKKKKKKKEEKAGKEDKVEISTEIDASHLALHELPSQALLRRHDSLDWALGQALAGSEWLFSSSSHQDHEEIIGVPPDSWEIDRRLLKIGEKIASGCFGDVYHGLYLGEDVAVKAFRPKVSQRALEITFTKEFDILRQVRHKNVVRFIGACTKPPDLCLVTEYLHRGNLYDVLHKEHAVLEQRLFLKFATDICKGMDYLHQKCIIHRDLKTPNLLLDTDDVVKVADFGLARFFQNREEKMTAETGTYKWMAPEVINHQPYNQKADVFSFAIVLWELATSKIPYGNMLPIQAAIAVAMGKRPELPHDAHPRLLGLMQRCWNEDSEQRPPFHQISFELEDIALQVELEQATDPTAIEMSAESTQ